MPPREVVELRIHNGMEAAIEQLVKLFPRIEPLADRVLVYTDDADRTLKEVHDQGIVTDSALVRRSTLEDVFLRLTGRALID